MKKNALQARRLTLSVCAALAVLAGSGASAQSVDGLRDAVRKALNANPDVSARYNAYRASGDAVDVARSGFLPRVDLNAGIGIESDRIGSRNPRDDTFGRTGVGLSLTQLLWDGLGTQRDVERAGHEKLARYFELLEATEQTSLEAARAWYDVQRFRLGDSWSHLSSSPAAKAITFSNSSAPSATSFSAYPSIHPIWLLGRRHGQKCSSECRLLPKP